MFFSPRVEAKPPAPWNEILTKVEPPGMRFWPPPPEWGFDPPLECEFKAILIAISPRNMIGLDLAMIAQVLSTNWAGFVTQPWYHQHYSYPKPNP